jgi:hypothetical protein
MGQTQPEARLREPARTAWTEPHSRRSNRASATGPSHVRSRQPRSKRLIRLSFRQTKPVRLASSPQRNRLPDMPERPPNHSPHQRKIQFPINPIPHRPVPVDRGFVLRGRSYASRRPKLFTKAVRSLWSAQRQESDVRSWPFQRQPSTQPDPPAPRRMGQPDLPWSRSRTWCRSCGG